MEENHNIIKKDISKRMGEVIFRNANFPIHIEDGKPVYNGKLNVKEYRKCFPGSDDYATVYLTLQELNSPLVEVIASIYKFELAKRAAVERNDYNEAARLRDQMKDVTKRLVDIIDEI